MVDYTATPISLTATLNTTIPDPKPLRVGPGSLRDITRSNDARQVTDIEDKKARDAANKFEALLIHNMLKSMRKTTMSENSSNEQSMYNDMLDEKLADTMIKAGGLGVADQIYKQIRRNGNTQSNQKHESAVHAPLQQLARDIDTPLSPTKNKESLRTTRQSDSTDVTRLRMATALWVSDKKASNGSYQQDFIQPLLPHAKHSANRLGTSAKAILAIAALETGWGKHMIRDVDGTPSNNLFGIKASKKDNAYTTTMTTEYLNGDTYKLQARFKKYDSVADSVRGFADFVLNNPRYSKALENAGDPEQFIHELQKAGYATDPNYATKAISIMRQIPKYSTLL